MGYMIALQSQWRADKKPMLFTLMTPKPFMEKKLDIFGRKKRIRAN